MTTATIDHRARAERLREVIAEHRKVSDDSLDDQGVVIEDARGRRHPRPKVPHRYVSTTFDGEGCWLEFTDSLQEAAASLSGLGGGDYPYAPGTVYDLDSEESWEPLVSVELRPLLPPGPCARCGDAFDAPAHAWAWDEQANEARIADHEYERPNPLYGPVAADSRDAAGA